MFFIKSHAENSKTLVTISRPHKKTLRDESWLKGWKSILMSFFAQFLRPSKITPSFFSQRKIQPSLAFFKPWLWEHSCFCCGFKIIFENAWLLNWKKRVLRLRSFVCHKMHTMKAEFKMRVGNMQKYTKLKSNFLGGIKQIQVWMNIFIEMNYCLIIDIEVCTRH